MFIMKHKKILFPYEKIRPIQGDMINEIVDTISKGGKSLINAPTGIGKTISVLGPALKYAMKNDKVVLLLTSRHTQHVLAVNTLEDIRKKYKLKFIAVDLIGKKWMCPIEGIENLYANEFLDYCKSQREDKVCEYFNNTLDKKELSPKAKKVFSEIESFGLCGSEKLKEVCANQKLCPYEMTMVLSSKAKVIIADYYYLFNPIIRDVFLNKIGLDLSDLIVLIDEGHNLGDRIRNLMSVKLSNMMLNRAIHETQENEYNECTKNLKKIKEILKEFETFLEGGDEIKIGKQDFVDRINAIFTYEDGYDVFVKNLGDIAEEIRKDEKKSSLGSIVTFLEQWKGKDKGHVRIFSKKKYKDSNILTLNYKCLDPSLITTEIIDEVYSFIIMSGTLSPLEFYKDTLGFSKNVKVNDYDCPFSNDNRLNLVIPKTTTKYSQRNSQQYNNIAKICSEVVKNINKNTIIFFPSYYLRDQIYSYFKLFCDEDIVLEVPGMNKAQKKEILDMFENNPVRDGKLFVEEGGKNTVLLAVNSGSFGEGIDLPGDLLGGVIVVGIPLQPPNLEVKELINYYDKCFSKGWDYGYVLPAITKILQNAGRCIRSETDKGVIVFLDQRYSWNNYFRCFPKNWDIKVTTDYVKEIKEFFK